MFEAVESLLEQLKDEAEASSAAESILRMEAESIVTPLRAVLLGRDPKWKAIVLERVVSVLSKEILLELSPELFQLAMNASDAEQDEGVDELAENALNRLFQR